MRYRLIASLLLVVAAPLAAQDPEVLKVPGAVAGLPFSPAVKVGNIIYLSGQIGNKMGTRELVPGGVGPETRQTMENIRTILEAAGSGLHRVFKCTVFMADMAEWPAMNEVYATFFPANPPARSAAGASGLALGARVEIECIAVAGR